MNSKVQIKELTGLEIDDAMKLVWEVFLEFEAPDYDRDGIETFYQTIHDYQYLSQLFILGAYRNEKLVGVIATRNKGSHIALFFVEGKCHRQGIGTLLFKTVLKKNKYNEMTVNSSPYALTVYERLGFKPVNTMQVVHGIKFIPMER